MNRVKAFLLVGVQSFKKHELLEIAEKFLTDTSFKKINKKSTKEDVFTLISKLSLAKIEQIVKDYAKKTAVHPIELCEYLGITKTERLRWQDSKIAIAYMDSWSFKYGSIEKLRSTATIAFSLVVWGIATG